MSSVNKVILVGALGRDPEIRSTQSGERIATLSLATSETWKDRNSGERKERTEWHRVVIFNERLSDVAEKYARKGSKLYIEGSLQTRKWTDQQGQERYSTEVVLTRFRGELVLLDSAEKREEKSHSAHREAPATRSTRDELYDEIPFLSGNINNDILLAQNRKDRRACI